MGSDAEAPIALSHLWRVAAEGTAALLRGSPGFERLRSPDHDTQISGEPGELFNWLFVHTANPENEARLRAGIAALRARGVPALVLISETLAAGLEPVAQDLDLVTPYQIPLMLLHPLTPATRPTPPGLVVERVGDDGGLQASIGLVSAAFETPAEAHARCFGPILRTEPAMSIYLARDGADALSTCWVWRDGPLAYVAMMASSPVHQRRGAGRAVLSHALAEHAATGATAACLIASTAGRPLYEQLGFRVVDDSTMWCLR